MQSKPSITYALGLNRFEVTAVEAQCVTTLGPKDPQIVYARNSRRRHRTNKPTEITCQQGLPLAPSRAHTFPYAAFRPVFECVDS